MAEWQNGRKWIHNNTYVLFMVHASDNDRMAERRNGEMAEWQNGRMAEWQNGRTAEWRTEWSNGGNGGNGGMADRMVEWREWREWGNGKKNGRMATWQKMDT